MRRRGTYRGQVRNGPREHQPIQSATINFRATKLVGSLRHHIAVQNFRLRITSQPIGIQGGKDLTSSHLPPTRRHTPISPPRWRLSRPLLGCACVRRQSRLPRLCAPSAPAPRDRTVLPPRTRALSRWETPRASRSRISESTCPRRVRATTSSSPTSWSVLWVPCLPLVPRALFKVCAKRIKDLFGGPVTSH